MGDKRWIAWSSITLGMLTLAALLVVTWEMSKGLGLGVVQAQPVEEDPSSRLIAFTAVTTRYVSSGSGNDAGDCTSDTVPCATIQYAVNQANDGDVVLIAALDNSTKAVYTGSEGEETPDNVVEVTKSLTLRGGYVYLHSFTPPVNTWTPGPDPSTVDGEDQRRALRVSGNVTVTLRMLAFVNGQAGQGGNVYAENARVRFVATPILSGTADYGGGLYLKNCRTAFDPGDLPAGDFVFDLDDGLLEQLGVSGLLLLRNNTADEDGGGIYVEGGTPVIAGLAIVSNSAHEGGGLYLKGGGPAFVGGLVLENQAAYRGGGFFLEESAARIAGAAVYSNTAQDGAGFCLDGPIAFSELTVPIIANNYVRYNRTTASLGGGFYFHKAIAGLVNNVVADNVAEGGDGAAMYLYASSPQVFHNTLAQNIGNSGVYVRHQPGQVWPPVAPIPSFPSFTNTVIVSHTVGVQVESTGFPAPLENKVTLEGTLWYGNGTDTDGPSPVIHTTDVYSAPRFQCTGDLPQCVLPYHVLTDSAAVDAGVVVGLSIPGTDLLVDIDGQMRPSNQAYDIGADEVVTRAFDVCFMPPASYQISAPGQIVTHVHRLMNTGLQTDTYDLGFLSSEGWAELLGEPGPTGTITLTPRTSETIRVRVIVPATATTQLRETSVITATSRGDAGRQSRVWDVTRVFTGGQTDVQVDKWANVSTVQGGEAVSFTLVVTNAGPLTGTLAVTLTDAVGPAQAVAQIDAPTGLCATDVSHRLVTCTLSLRGATLPVTQAFDVFVTTTGIYSGVLVNTAVVRSTANDENGGNNEAQAIVQVSSSTCVSITDVTIQGSTRVLSGTAVALTAAINPSEATPPILYVWQPQPAGSAILPGQSVATYTWYTTGTKAITVTASNCGDIVTDVHTMTIYREGDKRKIYLPLVLRNA